MMGVSGTGSTWTHSTATAAVVGGLLTKASATVSKNEDEITDQRTFIHLSRDLRLAPVIDVSTSRRANSRLSILAISRSR